MKPNSERPELRNNYINGFFDNKIEPGEKSNIDDTNNALLNNNRDFLLNKKIVRISPDNYATKNNSVQLKNNIIISDDSINIDKNEWFKNRLKLIGNIQEGKIIYNLEQDSDDKIKGDKIILSAYKDKGFYCIYKYLNSSNNYDKEVKAKIKWNIFSNHFKIYDTNNNILEEIIYNFNFKGWNGPTKLNILVPFWNKNIINGMKQASNNKLFMHKMENKSPEYNSIYKCYVLNFIKRKGIPHEKNIQIIYSDRTEDRNDILLQFAKVDNNEYILDYKYPFNKVTALALALTNLSSRIFCQ